MFTSGFLFQSANIPANFDVLKKQKNSITYFSAFSRNPSQNKPLESVFQELFPSRAIPYFFHDIALLISNKGNGELE
jgi:hypothetical protein